MKGKPLGSAKGRLGALPTLRLEKWYLLIPLNPVIQGIGTDKPILISSPTGETCFLLNLGTTLDCLSQTFVAEIGYHSISLEIISAKILVVLCWRNVVLAMYAVHTYAPVTLSKITLKGIWDG